MTFLNPYWREIQSTELAVIEDLLLRLISSRVIIIMGVKLGHVKNALFGVLTIAMYTTPKSAFYALFGVVYIVIVKTPTIAMYTTPKSA